MLSQAKECPPLPEYKVRESTIGFYHSVVLGVAGQIVDAVKSGAIKRFYLIGGCDGAESGRNYYTKLTESSPNESIILTLGCGKYRVRNHDYGTVAGLPRLLDMGQCNDAYGAVQVALSKAFDCGVNDLPLDIVLSWFEQKALMGLLSDAIMEAVAESSLDSTKTLQTQRAFNKLLWIQNDFITRHYQAAVPVDVA